MTEDDSEADNDRFEKVEVGFKRLLSSIKIEAKKIQLHFQRIV